MRVVTRNFSGETNIPEPAMVESYYATVVGVDLLDISDDLGNTNTSISDDGF